MIILAPDSFKGSLNALQVVQALALGIRQVKPDTEICQLPMADGGEGTLDVFLAAGGGRRVREMVTGADWQQTGVDYGILTDSSGMKTALIESAAIVGLAKARHVSIERSSSVGIGELVIKCLDRGIRNFLIGLGGSGTNDAGAGLLTSLGTKLLDVRGCTLTPSLSGLAELHQVDFSGLDPRLAQSDIQLLADVNNPLTGPDGATATYGLQKGIHPAQLPVFEQRVRCFSDMCGSLLDKDISSQPGTGAAGGIAYAFQLIGARYQSGAEMICDYYGLDAILKDASWLITGEGETNAQTLCGKAPLVVAQHARCCQVPAILISGVINQDCAIELAKWFDDQIEIRGSSMSLQESMHRASQLITKAAAWFARKYLY